MRSGWSMVRGIRGAALGLSLAWSTVSPLSALSACSSTSSPAASGPDASPVCPNTVIAANGSKCAVEGYTCWIGFPCTDPPIPQQAECVCTGGVYQCSNPPGSPVQGPIPPNSQPQCVSNGQGNDKACPTSESDGQPCSSQQAGLICFYKGVQCPENSPGDFNTDECQCVNNPNPSGPDGGTLAFSCERQLCNPQGDAAPPPPPDAGSDSGDAGTDGGTTD
jgi:hypothetical protein